MEKLVKLGLVLSFSASILAGCGSSTGNPVSGTDGYYVAADGTTASPAPGQRHGKGGHGMKGGHGVFFGLPADLNLTAEQKTALEALRPEKTAPAEADRTKFEAVQQAIKDAFISDNFDVAALKAQLEAAKPAGSTDRVNAEADRLVKTWNILTAEQRTLLASKQAEMAANVPSPRPAPSAEELAKKQDEMLSRLGTKLNLTEDQKTRLKEIFAPSADQAGHEARHAERKAAMTAVFEALKAGNATADSIAAIMKANEPTDGPGKGESLDRLAKIHAVLNAEQRKTYIESGKSFGFDKGGKGKAGKGHGGRGGPRA